MSTRIPVRVKVMRKVPLQRRSRATVETILEAGAHILSSEGWSGFSTNKVAERAGVSIGSVYQYFPDKISLVNRIRQRHIEDCLKVISGCNGKTTSVTVFTEALVEGMIRVHRKYPGLHAILLDEAPSTEEYRDPDSQFEQEYFRDFCRAVTAVCGNISDSTCKSITTLISDAIDGVIHNAARRGQLDNPDIRNGLICIIRLYLQKNTRKNTAL